MEQSAVLHWQPVVGYVLLGVYGILFLSDIWKGIPYGEAQPIVNHVISLAVGLVLSLFIGAVSKNGVIIAAWILYGLLILTTIVRGISIGKFWLGAFWTIFFVCLFGLAVLMPTFENSFLFFISAMIVVGESIGNLFCQVMLRKATHSAFDDFFDNL